MLSNSSWAADTLQLLVRRADLSLMKRRLKLALLLSMVAGTSGLICFAIGGVLGSTYGYLLGGRTSDALTARMVMASIHAHESGDQKTARDFLELVIDQALISEWSYNRSFSEPPFYVPRKYHLNLEKVVLELAQYRQAHPREQSGPLVAEIVERHTSGPQSK